MPADAPLYSRGTGVETHWASFENPAAEKGAGGQTNKGGKGNACETFLPGETKVLLDVKGSGIL